MSFSRESEENILELLTAGKYAELLEYCSEILIENPQNLTALKNKAYALYFLKRYEEAISFYDKAIELDPKEPSHYSGKSQTLEKLGRHDEAKSCYEQAKKIEDEQAGDKERKDKQS